MIKLLTTGILVIMTITTACDPVPTDFIVTNHTGQPVDFIFTTDLGSDLDDWPYYNSLAIGEYDNREGCRACDLRPDGEHRFDWKVIKETRMRFTARSSDGKIILFIAEYGYEELEERGWHVELIDQRHLRN